MKLDTIEERLAAGCPEAGETTARLLTRMQHDMMEIARRDLGMEAILPLRFVRGYAGLLIDKIYKRPQGTAG